ncbi:SMC-Scp complex subunit ScpB [Candidatus Parcubacteria bacterium]|nr:MAG: SMC-Scp complex subunit ScpB [Candidatus Parcubacteria bacterium]
MNEENKKNQLESLIFAATEPISYKKLAKLLDLKVQEIKELTEKINNQYKESNSGLRLTFNDSEVQMVTSPENSEIVNELTKSDLKEDLSLAALETLAIIIYKGSQRKVDIDFIRGVNSVYTLRTLLIRGLIERESDPQDARSFVYKPSLELIKKLGISNTKELPNYEEIVKKLDEIKQETLRVQTEFKQDTIKQPND